MRDLIPLFIPRIYYLYYIYNIIWFIYDIYNIYKSYNITTLQSHFEEAVYFLPPGFQKVLLLI